MSERAYDQPLVDDIFGSSTLTPEFGYDATTRVTEPVVTHPEYAPTKRQPSGVGEPRVFATLAGHEDMPILEYDDGRRVVRVPRTATGNAPINELPRAVAETLNPAPVESINSISFKMEQSREGGLSGAFAVKGQFMDLLGGLAGAAATNNKSVAPARQLESRIIPTQPTPQRVVAPTPFRPNEAPERENDNDSAGSETATIATRGLKKVIKAVLRPRLAGAVLALSVAVAGGAYRIESGELPIHGNPISILQADYNQVIHHPLATIADQFGKL